jgi:hypothetical protein
MGDRGSAAGVYVRVGPRLRRVGVLRAGALESGFLLVAELLL